MSSAARAPIVLIVSLIAAGLSVGRAEHQSPPPAAPQTPVFKSRLDIVRVDVTVIDNKSGKPISGLTERDFTVSENGVRQPIASFADELLGAASTNPDDPANRRVFLFILNAGDYGPYKQHEGVAQFIRERLRPRDLVGIMSLGRLSPLTADHERIAAIVDRLKQHPSLEYRELQITKKGDSWGEKPRVQRWADNFMEPGSADTAFFRSPVPLVIGSTQYHQNVSETSLPWHLRLGVQDPLKVIAGIEYLRGLPGDKHVVILTPLGFDPPYSFGNEGTGLFLRSTEEDKRVAAYANDAGVAVDIILTSGTGGSVKSMMSSTTVSDLSGGQYSSLRVAPQQLARIDEGTRNGYIIGYTPEKAEMDGKYRNITVSVNRKDVTVIYRHGYTAAANPEQIDPRDIVTRQRLRDAAAGASDLNDIRLDVVAKQIIEASKPQLRVSINIDVTKLPLAEIAGKWEGDLDMMILCGDRKKQVVCRLDQKMMLSMTQAKYDQAKATGVPYSATIPVTANPTFVKVIVYHFDSDRIGVFTMDLK